MKTYKIPTRNKIIIERNSTDKGKPSKTRTKPPISGPVFIRAVINYELVIREQNCGIYSNGTKTLTNMLYLS